MNLLSLLRPRRFRGVNVTRVKAMVAAIEADPGGWDQGNFDRVDRDGHHRRCAAGIVLHQAGRPADVMYPGPGATAADLLGIDDKAKWALFYNYMDKDVAEFKKLVTKHTGVRFP